METLIINIPDKKTALVKQLLKELGVSMTKAPKTPNKPNSLTAKTIDDARKGADLGEPITNIGQFIDSL